MCRLVSYDVGHITKIPNNTPFLVKKIENSCNKMQQMTDEISKIKESSVKNEEILTKIEKADKDSISKEAV